MNMARTKCCLKHNGKICKDVSPGVAGWRPGFMPLGLILTAQCTCSPRPCLAGLHRWLAPTAPAALYSPGPQVDSVDDSKDIKWEDDKPSKPSDSRRLLRMR